LVTRTLQGTETPRSEAWASGAGVAPHLVFLPSPGAPRLFLWGAGAGASALSACGEPARARLVDETLLPRQIEGVAIPLLDALPRLAAMTTEEMERAPASVAAWSLAAKLALDLVGRERLVPRVVPAEADTEARFAVALALPDDAERVAALAKTFCTHFEQKLACEATQILGHYGTLLASSRRVPFSGYATSSYLFSPGYTIQGGTSEILKNIIALRGLGLPSE